jgi:hypothetical protein
MLYMSAIPDAFDIAVIVTGDKDFIPALEKTRMRAKKVAICSVRSSCNKDLIKPESRVRDFDVIWLDDYVDDLLIPRRDNGRLGEWLGNPNCIVVSLLLLVSLSACPQMPQYN